MTRSLPVSTSTVVQNANQMSIGRAPYHETYGPGLRLVSRNQIGTIVRDSSKADYLVFKGFVGTTPTSMDGIVSAVYSKSSGTDASFSSAICGAALSFTGTQFGLFDKYCFRKYSLQCVNECAFTTRGSVVVVPRYDTNIINRTQGGTPSYSLFSAFPKAVEYGVKTPVVDIPIIADRDMAKPASVVYNVDVEGTLSNQNFQFHVCFASTDIPDSGTETVSRVFATSVIDLYGPHPTVAAPLESKFRSTQLTSSTAQSSASSSCSSLSSGSADVAKPKHEDYVIVPEKKDERNFLGAPAWKRA